MKRSVQNGQLVSTDVQIDFSQFKVLYEVMRIVDSTPLFLEHHLFRLEKSALISNFRLPPRREICRDLSLLIQKNSLVTGNVELAFWSEGETSFHLSKIVPHHYPTNDDSINGVKLGILNIERLNPQAKVKQLGVRGEANRLCAEQNVHEVLLINRKMEITEGSRSNIFFIKGEHVFTPPSKLVLEGITRKVIKEVCIENHISLTEKQILYSDIDTFDAVFMSGTSPGVLPVCAIEAITFNPLNSILKQIKRAYETSCDEDINYQKTKQR